MFLKNTCTIVNSHNIVKSKVAFITLLLSQSSLPTLSLWDILPIFQRIPTTSATLYCTHGSSMYACYNMNLISLLIKSNQNWPNLDKEYHICYFTSCWYWIGFHISSSNGFTAFLARKRLFLLFLLKCFRLDIYSTPVYHLSKSFNWKVVTIFI